LFASVDSATRFRASTVTGMVHSSSRADGPPGSPGGLFCAGGARMLDE
jgi:hypothetical protein